MDEIETFICRLPDLLEEGGAAYLFVKSGIETGTDEKGIYGKRMKNDRSAMISCNDGFRPVSFLIEALDEDA